MKYLLTGAAGMVASNLGRILCDAGHIVYGIDDLSRGKIEFVDKRVQFWRGDLADPRVLAHTPPPVRADVVIHAAARCGGVKHVMESEYANLKNSAIDWNVMEYCMWTGCKLVYLSTCCVYGAWLSTAPLREEDSRIEIYGGHGAYSPDEGLYGMAKLAGEMAVQAAVRKSGFPAVITRCFNIYGPNETPDANAHVIPALIGKVLRKELPLEVWGDGSQKRSFLYVDDACRGIMAALEKGRPGEVYNLGVGESYTVNELAKRILSHCNYDPSGLRNDPSKPSGVAARYADTTKARAELGWYPKTGIDTGLANTIAWCRKWREAHG